MALTWILVYRLFAGGRPQRFAAEASFRSAIEPEEAEGSLDEARAVGGTAYAPAIRTSSSLVCEAEDCLRQWELLEGIERKLSRIREQEPALREAAHAMVEDLGGSGAGLWTEERRGAWGGDRSREAHATSMSAQVGLLADPERVPDPGVLFSPWRHALAAGEAVCIPDSAAEPDLCGRVRLQAGSLVLAPISDEGGVRGTLVLAWASPLGVGPREMALARQLARIVGLALERARLRQELETRENQARVLVEAGGVLSRAPDLDSTFDGILHVVRDRLGYRSCALLLVDEGSRELRVASMAGYEAGVRDLRLPLSGRSVTATCAREGQAVNVREVSQWEGYVAGAVEARSEIALPLLVDGRALGVLDVESDRPAAFGPGDRITLEAVASQAALALAHFRLLGKLDERAARLQAVDEMARAISSTLDARDLFQIVVDQVRSTVRCDRATLLQFEPEAGEARLVAVSTTRRVEGLEVGSSIPLAELPEVEEPTSSAARYLPDLEKATTRFHSRLFEAGFRSLVRVPILIDGKIAGLFTAASLQPDAFTPAQISMLEAVAPHVSAALRNVRLFEQVDRSYQRLNEAHDQLVHSEQLRVLGEMASGVAHNFNNVLGAILGRAQLVRTRVGDPALARELQVIEQAAMDGAATVRRLQEFTRLRTDHAFVAVDLSQIARDALALTRTWWKDRAESKGLAYGIVCDLVDGAIVEGQAHELREVVTNVVLNAIEAMPSGGAITLRTRATNGDVVLEVIDTGVGMSEEVRSRIFHPFYSTKGPRGTGLGLSIAYGIVQRHGGTLEVDSSRGAGTTMRLVLPKSALEAPQEPIESSAFVPSISATILVVDDEPAIASLLVDLLETAGYRVLIARTGREAVERLVESPVHAVLTDLGMPEMSGWELARHCRDLHPDVPVLLVTGWGIELDEELVLESGVRGVVSKPFSVTEVLNALGRVLESPGPERKAA